MSQSLPSYLRSFRKRANLTQAEVAFLVGVNAASISRYEWGSQPMQLEAAFACQILFATSAEELFPGIYQQVEQRVIERAQELSQRLAAEANELAVSHKMNVLARLVAQGANAPPSYGPSQEPPQTGPGDRPDRHGVRLRRL